ncbi:AI-2E family transporter [Gymnodinialimonas ceratoperidinii]|uniref:AI-2E family transporter n=1 Tax=Gymnodinialimonas ceratoperidinii TaxID=2856823 RepID=A0A8F6YAK3_9RHOB|nr:AI-2E family transporter [Gymnodinialimonas ceratoperidinii]QXT39096.1 AI-2E family transporter [Gymnodinialimonas ceratoperidinii]
MEKTVTSARATAVASIIIVVILLAVVLDHAQVLIAPVLTAIVLGLVLAPFVDFVERRGIPNSAAALLILAFFLFFAGAIFYFAEPIVNRAISNGPMIWAELRSSVEGLRNTVEDVQQIQETMNEALTDGEAAEGAAPAEAENEAVMRIPSIFDVLSYGPAILGGILIFVGTLYFFLTTRRDVYARTCRLIPSLTETLLIEAEARVSRYFLAITMINAGFGAAVMVAMSALGVPQPIMWGLATFLLNFMLYLGPGLITVALLVVGIVTFDGFWAVMPALAFISLNMVESQFVTPTFVGRHMALNPLMVFLSLVFWLWLWGPIGGLVAIPIVVWIRYIVSDGKDDEIPIPAPLPPED